MTGNTTMIPAGFSLHPEALAPMPVVTLPIDPMATARRILSAPDAVYSATPFEIVAMAACTVRESTGELPALPVIADRPDLLSASIAAAVARVLRANRVLREQRRSAYRAILDLDGGDTSLADAVDEFNAALSALQTTFEKEFPNGSDL